MRSSFTKYMIIYFKHTAWLISDSFCRHTHVDTVPPPANFHPNPHHPWYSFFKGQRYDSCTLRRSNVIILQTVTDRTNIAIANAQSCLWPFYWHIYIWPWPILNVMVKVMHISTVNISQTVTDRANIAIAIANKYKVAYGLTIGIFTVDLGPL